MTDARIVQPAPTPQWRAIPEVLGALVGWKRFQSPSGVIVQFQTARSANGAAPEKIDEYQVALTAQQMRLLGEDLERAADEIEGRTEDRPRRRGWLR